MPPGGSDSCGSPPPPPQLSHCISTFSHCPRASGDLLRERVAAIVEGVAAANQCFPLTAPETHPLYPLYDASLCSVSFGQYAKVLSKAGRDDLWLAAIVLADRCCRRARAALTAGNMHMLMLAAFVLAAKCHVDACGISKYISSLPGFGHCDLNAIERSFLRAIDWDVYISAQDYEHYRGMLNKVEAAACRIVITVKKVPGFQREQHYPLLPVDAHQLRALSEQIAAAAARGDSPAAGISCARTISSPTSMPSAGSTPQSLVLERNGSSLPAALQPNPPSAQRLLSGRRALISPRSPAMSPGALASFSTRKRGFGEASPRGSSAGSPRRRLEEAQWFARSSPRPAAGNGSFGRPTTATCR
eukprot:TRINITY_DN55411_c0_g1_i1.p1 TRINITY_DN55411_c0_g1~~TRINITY_DN55411_c0_g1_i1.p1  ORF type:complete len:360 (+),score=48.62 TRINITY_DN55411_c0_g1_i1:67-1146(+)